MKLSHLKISTIGAPIPKMKMFITGDIFWESKVDKVLGDLERLDYRSFFEDKDYGESVAEIGLILMCQRASLNLKQRIRFSKQKKDLSMDIMLDLEQMMQLDHESRRKIIAAKIVAEVPLVLKKYKFKDFDLPRFSQDLSDWFKQRGWL